MAGRSKPSCQPATLWSRSAEDADLHAANVLAAPEDGLSAFDCILAAGPIRLLRRSPCARAFTKVSRELMQSANPGARHSVSGSQEDVVHDIYIGHER